MQAADRSASQQGPAGGIDADFGLLAEHCSVREFFGQGRALV
jgi:hypothetical protein